MMSPGWKKSDVIKEIISELSLRDSVDIKKLSTEDADVLQGIFDMYIGSKTGLADGDPEYKDIMKDLLARLKRIHRSRRVK